MMLQPVGLPAGHRGRGLLRRGSHMSSYGNNPACKTNAKLAKMAQVSLLCNLCSVVRGSTQLTRREWLIVKAHGLLVQQADLVYDQWIKMSPQPIPVHSRQSESSALHRMNAGHSPKQAS